MQQVTDATKKVVENIVKEIPSYLHPNPGTNLSPYQTPRTSHRILPASRAKLSMLGKLKKSAGWFHHAWLAYNSVRLLAAEAKYPHVSRELGDVFTKGGEELGDTPLGIHVVFVLNRGTDHC